MSWLPNPQTINMDSNEKRINAWLKSYLSDRTQREGEKSDIIKVESGVPQGSVLGPSLFLFYINDMPDNITSTVRLFSEDLNKLAKWEEKWMMQFHPDTCIVQ